MSLIITQGLGNDQLLITKGYGLTVAIEIEIPTIGPMPKEAIRKRLKEYGFDILTPIEQQNQEVYTVYSPIKKENKEIHGIYCPLKITKEKEIKLRSSAEKFTEKEILVRAPVDIEKLLKALKLLDI
jgi:RNase P/RNase MRP subunit p30